VSCGEGADPGGGCETVERGPGARAGAEPAMLATPGSPSDVEPRCRRIMGSRSLGSRYPRPVCSIHRYRRSGPRGERAVDTMLASRAAARSDDGRLTGLTIARSSQSAASHATAPVPRCGAAAARRFSPTRATAGFAGSPTGRWQRAAASMPSTCTVAPPCAAQPGRRSPAEGRQGHGVVHRLAARPRCDSRERRSLDPFPWRRSDVRLRPRRDMPDAG
jgi:hypothetical protein